MPIMKSMISVAALSAVLMAGTAYAQTGGKPGGEGGATAQSGGAQTGGGGGAGGQRGGAGAGSQPGGAAGSAGQPGGAAGAGNRGASEASRGSDAPRGSTERPATSSEGRATPSRGTAQGSTESGSKSRTQRNDRASGGDDDDKGKAARSRQTADDKGDRDGKTQDSKAKDSKAQDRKASTPASDDANRNRAADGRADNERRREAGDDKRDAGTKQSEQGQNGQSRAERAPQRAEISGEKRKRVQNAFKQHRRPDHVTRVDFEINIGRAVPRRVRLYPIPAVILSIVPQYRDYRYVVRNERYVIIDPSTYEVVYVIDSDGEQDRDAGLTLATDERQLILRLVDAGRPARSFNFRLGIGATVPQDIELREFPTHVVERVPRLRQYRFVVVEDAVVVVEPSDREVTLVIDR